MVHYMESVVKTVRVVIKTGEGAGVVVSVVKTEVIVVASWKSAFGSQVNSAEGHRIRRDRVSGSTRDTAMVALRRERSSRSHKR